MWDWMRVGKRVEWVMLFVGLLCWSLFAIPVAIDLEGDPTFQAILFAASAGFVLTLAVPAYAYLRFQRNEVVPPPLENVKTSPPAPISRLRLYGLLILVTLASATVQAYSLKPDQRPFGLSPLELYLWNFGILALLIAYLEFRRRNRAPNDNV